MTTISHRQTQTGPLPRLLAHVPAQAIGALNAVRRWQRRRRNERALEAMPFDLRKDIGWPSPDAAAKAGSARRAHA